MTNMHKWLLWALFPLTLLCSSCNDELDLTAEYKNITISYALLNPNDEVHYFKIYKGFLTDDNALEEAGNWENIYYHVDTIEVRFEEYNAAGTLSRSAILDTTTAIEKESGYFANPKQLLYYSTWTLDPECTYRLVIKNRNTDEEVYAETNIVGNCKISRPASQNPFNSKDNNGPKFVLTGDGSGTAKSNNVSIVDFYLIFHYIEVDNNTQAVTHKTVRKKMNGSYKAPQSDGDVSFDSFTPSDFLQTLKQQIEPNSSVTRYADTVSGDGKPYFCLQVQAWSANSEYYTYQTVANPGSSIVQDRQEYTNFVSENSTAYGLLASRNSCTRTFKFDNTNSNNNEDSLVNGIYTKDLGFDYYRNSPEFFEVTSQ